jgi:hypothetical protein
VYLGRQAGIRKLLMRALRGQDRRRSARKHEKLEGKNAW